MILPKLPDLEDRVCVMSLNERNGHKTAPSIAGNLQQVSSGVERVFEVSLRVRVISQEGAPFAKHKIRDREKG